jgi:hypothetical protein
MAHISFTEKLPTDARQYYMQAGGFVLLRFVKDSESFSVMTATASEDKPHAPGPEREHLRQVIFRRADGSPAIPLKPKAPVPEAMLAKVYPDAAALIGAAEVALQGIGSLVKHRKDQWGRRYVVVHDVSDPTEMRHAANRVAKALGLEAVDTPWIVEAADKEMRDIYEEFAIDDLGGDAFLNDGVWITKDGKLV